MQRFVEAFARAGFRPQTFCPVYGLAEATLFVSGDPDRGDGPTVRHVDRVALRDNRVTSVPPEHANAASVVGCGSAAETQEVVIVDPVTRRLCGPGKGGDVLV